MTCAVALNRLLEADPDELRGEASTDLARHLGECDRCAAVAAALRAELERLDQDLDAWARSADPDAAVDAYLGEDQARLVSAPMNAGRASALRRSPWARYAWIPLAAAAAVAGVVLVRPSEPALDPATPPSRIQPAVAVRPPADRGAVVMKTPNPRITIVWLYQREET